MQRMVPTDRCTTMNPRILLAATIAMMGAFLLPTPSNALSDPALTECYEYQWDSDRDGNYENWRSCGTPPCGCNCPVVGMILQVSAAGQDRNVAVWASCQSGYGTGNEASNNPNAAGVLITPVLYPAGLQPLIDQAYQILPAISCEPPLC